MAGKITKQSVQQFGQSFGGLAEALAEMIRRNRMTAEIDQARQGATNFGPVPIPGNPLAPMPLEAQAPTGFDQARFIQNLLPLLGRNPQATAPFQATMALQPQFKTANAGDIYGTVNPVGGKFTPEGQVQPRTSMEEWQPVEKNPAGLPVTTKSGNEYGYWTKRIVNGRETGEKKWVSQGSIPMIGGADTSFDEFRKTPDYMETIKKIADGSVKLSTSSTGRYATPTMKMKIIADVRKINPDYKEYTYDNDKTFKQQYLPPGRIGQKIANLNTAIAHTGELMDTVDKLGNNPAQFVNSIKNWFAQTFGTSRAAPLNTFEAIKSALSGELGALFKGGNAAATDPEIDNISKVINSAQNPQALKDALIEYLRVGKQRIDQFAVPYNERFSENNDFLNPRPRQLLQRFGVLEGGGQSSLTPEDQQAIEWAKANPNDPRAKEILKLHGQQ